MWDRITSTDIEQAKASLEAKRAATLSRHAEEIKDLDEQFCDIESFERVVEGFFEEYMSPDATPSGPAAASPTTPPAAAESLAIQRLAGPTLPHAPTQAAPAAPRPATMPAEAAMSAADRRCIQTALHRLGYDQGPADGLFGPQTRAAIRRFQQAIGAEPTGFLTAEEASRLVSTPAPTISR